MNGLLIDYNFCTGCHSCELACRQEKQIESQDEWGIKLTEMGPVKMQDKWLWDYVPVPSDLCDLCAERTAKGKAPSCVQHCQAQCLSWGDVEELARAIDSPKQMVVAVREA